MTNDEIQAFYNELESKRLKIKRDLGMNPSKYKGMTNDEKKWIKGEISLEDTQDPLSTVGWLFRDSGEERETEVVLDVLEATQDPKLVEIARKYAIVKPTMPSKIQEKIQMATVILLDGGGATVTTVGKELKQIQRRHEKISAREVKAMRKYGNISRISMTSLYHSFRALCGRLAPGQVDILLSNDYFGNARRRQFVLEHQEDVTSLFIDSPELKFAQSEKAGKLK